MTPVFHAFRRDLIPIVPGRFLSIHQPNIESHILNNLRWVQWPGDGIPGANCTRWYVAKIFDGVHVLDLSSEISGPRTEKGPYDGILVRC